MYIVISIIGNFVIEAFSLLVLRNRVKQKLYHERTIYNVTYLIKIMHLDQC